MVTQNDPERNISNGDIGVIRFVRRESGTVLELTCPDGRKTCWFGGGDPGQLALAYAITIHKCQGGQWDTVVIPLSGAFGVMMYRNLIYTAISRAKKKEQPVVERDYAIFRAVLLDCSSDERMIILETAKAVKKCLRKYRTAA